MDHRGLGDNLGTLSSDLRSQLYTLTREVLVPFQLFPKAFRGLLGNRGCLSSWDLIIIIL